MVIIDYQIRYHKQIIDSCVQSLRQGAVLAYPTDTCYGLAADAENPRAVKRLYMIKGRSFKKPIHVIPPSLGYAKKIAVWNRTGQKLAKKFWPGPLTLVLKLKAKSLGFKILSSGTGTIGLRIPHHKIALALAKALGRPITTTSANVAGGPETYSAEAIVHQFKATQNKPDIILNGGMLVKRQHSTVVKIDEGGMEILRKGAISKTQIMQALRH